VLKPISIAKLLSKRREKNEMGRETYSSRTFFAPPWTLCKQNQSPRLKLHVEMMRKDERARDKWEGEGEFQFSPFRGVKQMQGGLFFGWFTWAKGRIRGILSNFQKCPSIFSEVKSKMGFKICNLYLGPKMSSLFSFLGLPFSKSYKPILRW
jgi:hypothetical protein